ncbi:MAG: DJ-1 family protein [Parcubacteria group bacterium CG_4_10_14_0_8_um_filter_35_7]|nr:MAG: DJ-1 family protein [Parcubacteria group bacterium CG_4_10_14_0_8_um_filter_35_7]
MRHFLILLITFIFLTLFICGCVKKKEEIIMPEVSGKKIVMILAPHDFRDEEYFDSREVFEKNGIEVFTSSSSLEIRSVFGKNMKVDFVIDKVDVKEFDGIVFVGGPGATEYQEDSRAHIIAQEAIKNEKVLGAICIAPTILAKAGVLKGKNVTVWKSAQTLEILKEGEANFLNKDVVVDGKIVTANGPKAAKGFAQEIVKLLSD